jgi:hypothetical protein
VEQVVVTGAEQHEIAERRTMRAANIEEWNRKS